MKSAKGTHPSVAFIRALKIKSDEQVFDMLETEAADLNDTDFRSLMAECIQRLCGAVYT
jgi:hypothetical protein